MKALISLYVLLIGLLLAAPAAAHGSAWGLWVKPSASEPWHLAEFVPAWYESKADCESTATFKRQGSLGQNVGALCLPQGVEPTNNSGSGGLR